MTSTDMMIEVKMKIAIFLCCEIIMFCCSHHAQWGENTSFRDDYQVHVDLQCSCLHRPTGILDMTVKSTPSSHWPGICTTEKIVSEKV